MRHLKRDSFGRISYLSRIITHRGSDKCAWCNNPGLKLIPDRYGSIFALKQYGYENDSLYSGKEWESKLFCCKSCHDSYKR